MRRLSPARREHTALPPEATDFPGAQDPLKEEGSVLEVRDRRLRGKVGCLGPEVRPVTVPQITPKEERCVLGYASDD